MITNAQRRRCRTKVVATIGPASDNPELLRELLRSGMDVARLNFSHGSHADHAARIERLRCAADEEDCPLAIMQDLTGPRLRVGRMHPDVLLSPGQLLVLTADDLEGDARLVTISQAAVLCQQVQAGDRILIDDGQLQLVVRRVADDHIETEVVVGGPLRTNKGINLPDTDLVLPPLTAKDLADLSFGLAAGVDYVALSFVGTASEVLDLKARIATAGYDVPVIAKIERRQAVENLESIVEAADAVMVARGDLALEIGAERVPMVQKDIIRVANERARPVITATQMLESMIDHPLPTRAETSDVANAILDGTDAVMLSAETASGDYPVEAVRQMKRIALEIERVLDYERLGGRGDDYGHGSVPYAISGAAVQIAAAVDAAAIIAMTSSGSTAQRVADRRPRTPLYGATRSETAYRRLALTWGVEPIRTPPYETTDEMIRVALATAESAGLVKTGDLVVITSGLPLGVSGTTNMVQVQRVGGGRA